MRLQGLKVLLPGLQGLRLLLLRGLKVGGDRLGVGTSLELHTALEGVLGPRERGRERGLVQHLQGLLQETRVPEERRLEGDDHTQGHLLLALLHLRHREPVGQAGLELGTRQLLLPARDETPVGDAVQLEVGQAGNALLLDQSVLLEQVAVVLDRLRHERLRGVEEERLAEEGARVVVLLVTVPRADLRRHELQRARRLLRNVLAHLADGRRVLREGEAVRDRVVGLVQARVVRDEVLQEPALRESGLRGELQVHLKVTGNAGRLDLLLGGEEGRRKLVDSAGPKGKSGERGTAEEGRKQQGLRHPVDVLLRLEHLRELSPRHRKVIADNDRLLLVQEVRAVPGGELLGGLLVPVRRGLQVVDVLRVGRPELQRVRGEGRQRGRHTGEVPHCNTGRQ
eukprot:Rhum_TRINITY_DN16455_c0_g1::Rhum_TRINITY_DN16455_c0_g1_i1::g.163120::m.163120